MIAAAACSSSNDNGGGDGTVAVTGSLMGAPLAGLDNAMAATVTDTKGSSVVIVLAEGADCAALTAGDTAGATYFTLSLAALDGSGDLVAPTAPATFQSDPNSAGPYVEGDVEQLGSDCSQSVAGQFATGTVTVTSLQGSVISGSIDLANGADTASGTFTTVSCPGIATRAQDSGSAACN